MSLAGLEFDVAPEPDTFPVRSGALQPQDLRQGTDDSGIVSGRRKQVARWADMPGVPVSGTYDFEPVRPYEREQVLSTSKADDRDLLARSLSAFAGIIDATGWFAAPPSFFKQAIDAALAVEAISVARELATLGHQRYPANTVLKRAARVLAPPRVIATNLPPKKGLSAFMQWFEQHANEHRGAWVAVQMGELIGEASSHEALVEQFGDISPESGIIISRIP